MILSNKQVITIVLLIALSVLFITPSNANAEICAAGPVVCAAMFAPLVYLVWLLIPKGNTQNHNRPKNEQQLSGTPGIVHNTPKDSLIRYDVEDNNHMVFYF